MNFRPFFSAKIGAGPLIPDITELAEKVEVLARQEEGNQEALADPPEDYLDPIMSTLMTGMKILRFHLFNRIYSICVDFCYRSGDFANIECNSRPYNHSTSFAKRPNGSIQSLPINDGSSEIKRGIKSRNSRLDCQTKGRI